MSLVKNISLDKYEIVGKFKIIQIRELVKITENDNVVSTSFHRRTIVPGQDVSQESQEIRNIVAALHTQTIIDAYNDSMPPINTDPA